MSPHGVPIHWLARAPRAADPATPTPGPLPTLVHDRRQRPWRDLRISLTDRCNFRCSYCMPRSRFGPGHRFLPQAQLLNFEEISQVADAALRLGVRTLRLTGGEPLLRRELPLLVRQLAALRTPEGLAPDLALTTNGSLLAAQAGALREAGLQRLTVSLDALDPELFGRMNEVGFPVAEVLRGIEAAQAAGFERIKVNMVVRKGVNEHEALPMAAHFRGSGVVLRFIEFMDTGCANTWRLDQVLPSQQLCGDCTRARLTADGRVFTCLFGSQGLDLRPILRGSSGGSERLRATLAGIWQQRTDAYSEQRGRLGAEPPRRAEMHELGG
jgi:cyclic pyranopterin phosphate synthase